MLEHSKPATVGIRVPNRCVINPPTNANIPSANIIRISHKADSNALRRYIVPDINGMETSPIINAAPIRRCARLAYMKSRIAKR